MRGEVRYAEYFCLIALSHVGSLSPFNGATCQNLTSRTHRMAAVMTWIVVVYIYIQLRGETTSTKDEIQPKKNISEMQFKAEIISTSTPGRLLVFGTQLLFYLCLPVFFFFFFPGRTRHTAIPNNISQLSEPPSSPLPVLSVVIRKSTL